MLTTRKLSARVRCTHGPATFPKVYAVDEAHMLTREAWNGAAESAGGAAAARAAFVFAITEPQTIVQVAWLILLRLQ